MEDDIKTKIILNYGLHLLETLHSAMESMDPFTKEHEWGCFDDVEYDVFLTKTLPVSDEKIEVQQALKSIFSVLISEVAAIYAESIEKESNSLGDCSNKKIDDESDKQLKLPFLDPF